MYSNRISRLAIFSLILFSTSTILFAQTANKSPLSIEQIMQRTDSWRGAEPENIYWGHDSQTLYFDWNPDKDTLSVQYKITVKNNIAEKVSIAEKQSAPGRGLIYNADFSKMAYIRDGNLFVSEGKNNRIRQLTSFSGRISSPAFSADSRTISFVYNQNLYQVELASGMMVQLTDFIAAEERQERKSQGQALWLENQQNQLFDVLREKEQMEKTREYRSILEETEKLERIYLGKERPGSVSLSPAGRFIAFSSIQPATAKETGVTHFVTASGYTEERAARTKVGAPQAVSRLSVYDRVEKKVIPVKTDSLPGIKDLPDFWEDYPDRRPSAEKAPNRLVNVSGPVWSPSGESALVIVRAHDNKDRWICLLNPLDGSLKVLDRQRDEAWIAGPGISGFAGSAGWLSDHETVWFQSEGSGYSHLYTVNVRTGDKKQVTAGQWEVYSPELSRDGKYFWFTANLKHPGIRHFYRVPVTGGSPEQITTMDGGNEIALSPDEKWLAFRHSTGNKPWELFIQENKAGARAQQITRSTTPEYDAYPWRMPEYVTFTAADGETVHARLYRPAVAKDNGPAVLFVHGAGYLQNAHQWWSSYFREYMFHNLLADNGYTVLDIDYRGSAGYGRDWRTGIYRHMGGKDLSDHVDAAQYLVENHKVAPGKIGIYGGSYGGFITLMAMFNHPDVFAAGAALRSVTDWAHYNHGYTSNILNTPEEDSLAYARSSPIYFAEGLQGALLMCHGMVDDNVQFQDIVRITQRLIELGKENWELAVYPVESHGFTEPSSWIDEYKRIFRLFENYLK
jgi:dipeptidyl aminopeptidase/acylaminoacyl peptidase